MLQSNVPDDKVRDGHAQDESPNEQEHSDIAEKHNHILILLYEHIYRTWYNLGFWETGKNKLQE